MWRYFQEVNFLFDQSNLIITCTYIDQSNFSYLSSLFALFDKCFPYSFKNYLPQMLLIFCTTWWPYHIWNRPHTCIQRDDESRVKKKHIYNTYDFLRLQNKTRTLRKITHTTAHPTAMPITAPFVLVSLVPLLVADSVSKVVC